jgi:hypothetical protein
MVFLKAQAGLELPSLTSASQVARHRCDHGERLHLPSPLEETSRCPSELSV